ncbi:amino acid ABC transporter permease [Rhizobium sp. YJ-22]|uniref:amino acid ABC transporter permease n=1 Tax=Rhizobium sp. YJ-22 TaxID=3037556 RepID=UPI002412D209|nr:amino acid ABC transporter permease [Rhizobium sp. YJ-22]MDG3576764.1 amino acid ABC transporter permease [Rhizobium sp. YJ-22]
MDLLNLSVVAEYYPVLLRGFGMTILMTLIVITLSLTLAIPVALSRMSGNFLVRLVGGTYVELLRGTPLVLQLVYIYFVLPGVGIRLDGFVAALVALTLHYTAYLSEVYRAGIQSVPKGQTQAASALGMSRSQTFIRIVLPQAVRTVTPALGNYFISLFKDTALASVVTVQELLFSGQIIAARTYQYFTIYTVCMIMYFSVGYPAALFVRWLEKRTSGGYARRRRRQKGGQA